MIQTEKTREILINNGADPNCPRVLFDGKVKEDYSDQGIGFEDELLLCKGYAESGWVLNIGQHRHPVCNICQIRGIKTCLTREAYLKLIS